MRVLLTVWPMAAHLYPTVPLAWALQGAGHEVRVASHPALTEAVTAAGLTAVPIGDEETMPPLSSVGDHMLGDEERERLATALGIGAAERHTWHMFGYYTLASLRIFNTVGAGPDAPAPGVDGLVEIARDWEPDLVLWDMWPAAGVAAGVCGAAHARILWGPDYCGWARNRYVALGGLEGTGVEDPLMEVLRPVAARYGLEADDELLLGQWTVDPTPPALRLPTRVRTVPVRRVPFTGSGAVPLWLRRRPERPRVALSLGLSGRMFQNDEAVVAAMLETVDGLDVEVVATFDDSQLGGQRVPANVRVVDYVPLNQLLPTCSAVVHHGGGGTTTAALAQRVPQLVLEEEGVEAAAYAGYLTDRGAALTLNPAKQSAAEMRERLVRVLEEPSFRAGAQSLYEDWLAMPSPNDVVPVLEGLTACHRARR